MSTITARRQPDDHHRPHRQRHCRHCSTQCHQDRSSTRNPGVRAAQPDHVRAAVRVRVRQLDQGAKERGYREFLIAGIFAQTVVFGASFTGAGIADDMQKGIIDRFRSLPMSRAAVLAGRTLSDVDLQRAFDDHHGTHGTARRVADPGIVRWHSAGSRCCCSSRTRLAGSWRTWHSSFRVSRSSTTSRSW